MEERKTNMIKKDISKMDREELLNTLTDIQQILINIGEKIKEISDTETLILQEEKNADKAFDALSSKMSNIALIGVIGFAIMGFVGAGQHKIIVALLLAIGGGWFLGHVLGFIDLLLFRDEKTKNKTDYQNQHVKPLKEALNKYSEALEVILNNADTIWAMEALQEKYFDINAVNCFLSYITYRRADSYKEAVNLYEEEIHRFRMEDLQQMILENAEKTTRMTEQNLQTLKNVEASTASAARTAKIGAVINYATYSNIRKMRKNK